MPGQEHDKQSQTPDGATVTTHPDGITETAYPDGSTVTVYPSGGPFDEYPFGATVTTYPNGTTETAYPDGSTVAVYPPGDQYDDYPNGATVTTYPPGGPFADYPLGATVTTYPDGTTDTAYPDGGSVTVYPPGNPFGEYPLGATITTYTDGTTETVIPDEDDGDDGEGEGGLEGGPGLFARLRGRRVLVGFLGLIVVGGGIAALLTRTSGSSGNDLGATTLPGASAAAFGLGLSNSTFELSFTHRVFTSCQSVFRASVAPAFSGGWEIATEPGATGKPTNATLSPEASSPGGDFMNGTILSNGELQVSGNGPYASMHLILMLPAAVSTGHFVAPVNVAGTAAVQSHFKGGAQCGENWKVDGTLSAAR